jgi:uncharacterized membrane protein
MENQVEQRDNLEKHPKQDFQVERLAFFSDAVFAIAITLLVIEFKAPHITENSTVTDILSQLFDLKYHFFALLLSFILITVYWMKHHQLLKYLHNYNKQIIIANMLVLLPIIFFPFTTTFMAESISTTIKIPENATVYFLGLRLFLLNHFFAISASYFFYWVTIIKYKEKSYEMPKHEKIKFTFDSLFGILFFASLFIITLISNNILSIYLIVPLLLLRIILRKKIAKLCQKKI